MGIFFANCDPYCSALHGRLVAEFARIRAQVVDNPSVSDYWKARVGVALKAAESALADKDNRIGSFTSYKQCFEWGRPDAGVIRRAAFNRLCDTWMAHLRLQVLVLAAVLDEAKGAIGYRDGGETLRAAGDWGGTVQEQAPGLVDAALGGGGPPA